MANLWELLKRHATETYDTLSQGKVGQDLRADGNKIMKGALARAEQLNSMSPMDTAMSFGPMGIAGALKPLKKLPANLLRANEQGFRVDEPLYHGTSHAPFIGFDDLNAVRPDGTRTGGKNSVSLTPSPEFASDYALHGGTGPVYKMQNLKPAEGAHVLPLLTRGELWTPDNPAHLQKAFDFAAGKYGNKRYWDDDEVMSKLQDADWRTIEHYLGSAFFKKNKFTGAKVNELGVDNVIMYDPTAIRSPHAKFDPAKKNSTNLLASLLAGIGLSKTYKEEQQ